MKWIFLTNMFFTNAKNGLLADNSLIDVNSIMSRSFSLASTENSMTQISGFCLDPCWQLGWVLGRFPVVWSLVPHESSFSDIGPHLPMSLPSRSQNHGCTFWNVQQDLTYPIVYGKHLVRARRPLLTLFLCFPNIWSITTFTINLVNFWSTVRW